jgi:leader peptidase (prepilin peptidase)/N-methyltransferase
MNTEPSDRFQRFQTATLVAVGLAMLLLVGLPTLTAIYDLSGRPVPPQLARFLPLLEPVYAWLLGIFLAVWIVFFGGCIASFLNVVAWRLPRGKSILGRSHCPQCNTQLSLQENLPLYGWLACGGKCRYCQQPIPSRYFWVELAFGLILLVVGLVEVGTGGWSLPQQLLAALGSSRNSFLSIDSNLLWLFGSHVCLLSALYAYTLVRLESRRIPLGICLIAIIAALATLLASPLVAQSQWLGLDWITGQNAAATTNSLWSVAVALAGLPFGGLVGWLTSQLLGGQRSPIAKRLLAKEAALVLGTVAVFLGLCSALAVAAITLALLGVTAGARGRATSYSLAALLATVVYLCVWRALY